MTSLAEIIKTITQETPNIIMIKNYDGKFIFGNHTLATLYGTTPEGLVGKTDEDFNPNKEQTDFYLKNIQEIMDKNEIKTVYEESTDATTQEVRYYKSIKKPFIDNDGNKNILVVANDVTDLENEKRKIDKKEKTLETALKIIGEGVWDWDLDTSVVKHNQQWCDMFFVDDSKLEHHLDFFVSIIHPDDASKVFDKIQNALKMRQPFKSEHRMVCKDGSIKWVKDRGEIVEFDGVGNPKRMIGCVKDITDTIKLQEKEKLLEKQSRLATLGEMLGNIAHQWRQPLSVISTIASSVSVYNSLDSLDAKTVEKSMDTIVKQSEYLSVTINDFRNFIKNDRNKQNFYIVELINKSLSLADAAMSKYFIQVVVNLEQDALCNGFESEILQALLNILNNGKDILAKNVEDEERRFIFVTTEIIDETIQIKIKDNAGGVPEEIINRIFEPYFTTKGENDGTGLGLHMCRQIVEDSLGTVRVNNEEYQYNGSLYKGAEFVISFPIIHEDVVVGLDIVNEII
jgi:PAS domain S-box-containing protein